ncbi:2158_t:CDS:2, partial [Racocetra persica]
WNMRMVEDDGEIDEDFPAKQNEAASNKLRASTYKENTTSPIKNGTTEPALESGGIMSNNSTSKGSAVDFTNQIFLRVRVTLNPNEEVAHTTTVPALANTPFQDVLESICRKRKLDINKYTLKIADTDKYINMEKTVESIGNAKELALVEKSTNGTSTAPEVTPPSPTAIDGDYIHIMPSETRTMFESVKTSSYHITSVMSCKVNKKAPANFKLVIYRDSGTKTYDFEAESTKLA